LAVVEFHAVEIPDTCLCVLGCVVSARANVQEIETPDRTTARRRGTIWLVLNGITRGSWHFRESQALCTNATQIAVTKNIFTLAATDGPGCEPDHAEKGKHSNFRHRDARDKARTLGQEWGGGVLDETEAARRLLELVETHHDALDLARAVEKVVNLRLCREIGQVAHVEAARLFDGRVILLRT